MHLYVCLQIYRKNTGIFFPRVLTPDSSWDHKERIQVDVLAALVFDRNAVGSAR